MPEFCPRRLRRRMRMGTVGDMSFAGFLSQIRARIPEDRIASPVFADVEADPFSWLLLAEDLVSGAGLDATVVNLGEFLAMVGAHSGELPEDVPDAAFQELLRIVSDSTDVESVSLAYGTFDDPFPDLAAPGDLPETLFADQPAEVSVPKYSVSIRAGAYLCSHCHRPEHLLTVAFVRSGHSPDDISGRFALYSELCEDKPLVLLWSTDALPAVAASAKVPFGLVVALDRLMVSLLGPAI